MKFKKIVSYAFFFNLSLIGMGLFASSAQAALVEDTLEGRLAEPCGTIANETSTVNVSQTCLETITRCEVAILDNFSNIAIDAARAERVRVVPGGLVPIEPQDIAAIRALAENQLAQAIDQFRAEVTLNCQPLPLPPPPAPVNPPAVVTDDVADQIVADTNANAAEGGCTLGSGIGGSVNYLYLVGMLLPLLGLRRK